MGLCEEAYSTRGKSAKYLGRNGGIFDNVVKGVWQRGTTVEMFAFASSSFLAFCLISSALLIYFSVCWGKPTRQKRNLGAPTALTSPLSLLMNLQKASEAKHLTGSVFCFVSNPERHRLSTRNRQLKTTEQCGPSSLSTELFSQL